MDKGFSKKEAFSILRVEGPAVETEGEVEGWEERLLEEMSGDDEAEGGEEGNLKEKPSSTADSQAGRKKEPTGGYESEDEQEKEDAEQLTEEDCDQIVLEAFVDVMTKLKKEVKN